MARREIKAERAEEILDAFERCVVRYGVEGAGLQKVADEAGLTRSLLRHNVGNRDELLDALVQRFSQRGDEQSRAFTAALPDTDRAAAAIELLFDPRYRSNAHDTLLYQALQVAAQTRPSLQTVLLSWYEAYLDVIRQALRSSFPDTDAERLEAVTTGIIAVYFNADSMAAFGNAGALFRQGRDAAAILLEGM